MLEFMHKAAKVTDDIMTCFAIGLGLPEDYYKEASRLSLKFTVNLSPLNMHCTLQWTAAVSSSPVLLACGKS